MLRTYLRINRVCLVGAARLSPGSGDAVGRAAPDLLLVRRLLLESCRPGTASRWRGRRLGRVEIGSTTEQRGIRVWADPKS